MRAQHILVISLFAFAVSACIKQQGVRVPADTDSISYSSVSITVSLQRKDAALVEGGFISGIIYRPGLRIEPDSVWSDGTPASISIEVPPDALQSIIQSLGAEFSDMVRVYTYSEWRAGAPRNPDLGVYTSDYFAHLGEASRVSIRFSGVKDDYNRSMWFVVPMGDVDEEFWGRLKKAMPADKQFQDFITELKTFWINNA